jgi:hypothetical protein
MGASSLIQIIAAIAVVIILFVIGFSIYNRELVKTIQDSRRTKRVTPIFTGVLDFNGMHPNYDTLDPSNPSYKNLSPSINQQAGAEFTYNFWFYQESDALSGKQKKGGNEFDTSLNDQELILLLKGDPRVGTYKNVCNKNKTDVVIKCPLIKLSQGGDVLSVELNTVQGIDGVRENARNVCNDLTTDWNYGNGHKLAIANMRSDNLLGKWYMVSVVIQDTSPTDPMAVRNKVRVRIYINGNLELDRFVDGKLGESRSLLRQNTGNLYVNALAKTSANTNVSVSDVGARKVMMGDLTYYNYALDQAEITKLVNKGFQKTFVAGCGDNMNIRDKEILQRMSVVVDNNNLNPF